MSQPQCARARALNHLFYIRTAADAKIPAEVAALGTAQLKIGLANWGYWEDAKSTKYRSPWPKWKTLTSAPLWRTGNKGAPALPQTLAVGKQLQRKTEAPSLAPSQTQLSAGDVINVSEQDEQGSKLALTGCHIEDIEETPPARFRDLQYPLWVINADLFIEYDSAGFVPKWLFDVMMLKKTVIFHGKADVVHRIGRDMQRLWRMEKDKDPTTVPFYHVRLPVYSWLWGPVTSSTYQFDEHCMWIRTRSRWDKQVYLLLLPVTMPLCARGLAHCFLRYSSLFITFTVAELCDAFRWTFQTDAEQEPRWFHASDSRAVLPAQISFGQWVCCCRGCCGQQACHGCKDCDARRPN